VIYLDYAATSPVDPEVAAAMAACLTADGDFANPASTHAPGLAARRIIDDARTDIAALVGASAERLVFTSGATEANNMALAGMFRHADPQGHLVTTRIEHRSVLDTARALETEGVTLTLVECDENGIVAPDRIAAALRADTRLVSVMQVNNEVGSIQDIAAIAKVCHEAGVPLHVDAAQGAGKVPLDIADLEIDLCSLTAHKLNGPKGVGALYIRDGLELAPFLYGGDRALGVRAGTLPTHQIAGFGRAFALAADMPEPARLAGLRDRLWHGLAALEGARRNGDPARSAPHILSVSFPGIEGESLRAALADIAVSAGSACTSRSAEPSHVLRSLGLGDQLAEATLRFGVGRFTSEAEIDQAVAAVSGAFRALREVSSGAPDWCSG
jgi:cysteine desulfurase